MILVHLPKSWPDALNGKHTPDQVTLGEWALVREAACEQYGDVVLGIYKNEVVTAYDITGWSRNPADGRVTFEGKPSGKWAHLVGDANPGSAWVRGQARPVQYLNTNAVLSGTVETEALDDGSAVQSSATSPRPSTPTARPRSSARLAAA